MSNLTSNTREYIFKFKFWLRNQTSQYKLRVINFIGDRIVAMGSFEVWMHSKFNWFYMCLFAPKMCTLHAAFSVEDMEWLITFIFHRDCRRYNSTCATKVRNHADVRHLLNYTCSNVRSDYTWPSASWNMNANFSSGDMTWFFPALSMVTYISRLEVVNVGNHFL